MNLITKQSLLIALLIIVIGGLALLAGFFSRSLNTQVNQSQSGSGASEHIIGGRLKGELFVPGEHRIEFEGKTKSGKEVRASVDIDTE